MKFDELNQLKRFYKVMDLPQEDRDKRVSLGMFFYDALYYVLSFMETDYRVNGMIDTEFYKKTLTNRLEEFVKDYPIEDDYIPQLVDEVIDTTERHLDDMYYFSKDRALLIAQNEANTVCNHQDYIMAMSSGKKYKRWSTEQDERVRPAHALVDEQRIPIDDFFLVGNDRMRFPHDFEYGSPENLINCRCVCVYE